MIDRSLFIINPNSSNGAYGSFLKELKTHAPQAHILLSQSKQHTEEYIKTHWENYDIFVAVGGDGTISSIAQCLVHSDKILAVYPMGSGNGFARENGFGKEVKGLLQKIEKKAYSRIDTVRVGSFFSINVAGVGLDSAVAHAFERTKRGFLNYIKTTIKTFFSFKDITVRFKDPQLSAHNGHYLMLCVANTRQFGNNAYIAPQAKMDDGKIDLVLVKRFPLYYALIFAYQLFSKGLANSRYTQYISTHTTEIEVDFPLWHIDGDAVEMPQPTSIQVVENSLKVLR